MLPMVLESSWLRKVILMFRKTYLLRSALVISTSYFITGVLLLILMILILKFRSKKLHQEAFLCRCRMFG